MKRIIEVKTKRDINRFINFQTELYKGNPYFVPMLIGDEKKIFKKNYVYNKTCKTIFFLCVDEKDKVLGRIEGIIQIAANEKWKQQRVRFTRFDCINDQEVANMLLDAVVAWAKPFGIKELVGPLGYSDMEREGLLIDGFDKIQTYEEQYNHEYYQYLLDNYGLKKDVDWIEYKILPPKKMDERFEKMVLRIKDRYGLRIYQPDNIKKFIKKYKNQFFELVDKTYNHIYGTVPFTQEMMDSSISNFTLILRPEDLLVIFNEKNEMVAMALMFPSISEVVTKYKGRITPGFIYEFFKNKKHPKIIDLGLVGVLPEYSSRGATPLIIYTFLKKLIGSGVEHLETNLMLEHNTNILGFMDNFEHEYTKKRRCYVKEI